MLQRKIEEDRDHTIDFSERASRSVEELPSVTSMISPEQQKRFIKKLFKGDAATYHQLLRQLDDFSSWGEAHHFLEKYFQEHRIDQYHDEAVRFSDLVYRRYFPQDEYIYTVHADFAQTDLRFLPFMQPVH